MKPCWTPLLLVPVLLPACRSSGENPGDPGAPPAGLTRWGRDLDRARPLPDHPRPTLVRERWRNLNGTWQFEPGAPGQPPPFDRNLRREVLVPFPVESVLSGVGEHHPHLWYRRSFEVPSGWRGDRVLLHFGAVDQEAEVWVNGRRLALHRGGYDPFTVDVTDALLPIRDQELLVRVFDPTDEGEGMRGKQTRSPGGIWYSPVSGIWQTVWMEPVPRRGVEDLRVEPDLESGRVAVTAVGEDVLGTDLVEVEVLERGGLVAARSGGVGERLVVPLPAARAWSPEDPFLYDLRVTRSAADGRVLDRVTSYFALRTVERVVGEDGRPRLLLNGEPRFLQGVLDQGWWPDGLYTAPADDALRWDVATARELGFDLIRKHVKVEPERWYAWCDRLGMLVMQDVPNAGNRTEEGREAFERQLEAIVRARRDHPSIIGWVLFNEGWGQYDTLRLTRELQALDPARLVTCASGWNDAEVGDVIDVHHYPGPRAPRMDTERLAVVGEYGGVSLPVRGHAPGDVAWGYRTVSDADELVFAYEGFARDLRRMAEQGLAAAVYTQLTDVETETNGLVTYDREVIKADAERIARANLGDLPPVHTVLPTSERAGRGWRYRLDSPRDWRGGHGPGLDLPGVAEGWTEGVGGFGREGTPGAVVRTPWTSSDIWLVTDFQLGAVPDGEVVLRLHHDEDVEVWINGRAVLEREGFTTSYVRERTGVVASDLLRVGQNRVAVRARNTTGGQYVDVGVEVVGER